MKLAIHHSRTECVRVEVIENAMISDVVSEFYLVLAEHYPDQLEKFKPNALFQFTEKWLELDKTLADYGITADQHLKVTSLQFTQEDPGPQTEHIPSEFICELTGLVFLDPMLIPSGETAEREYLNAWIAHNGTSPFNRQPLEQKDLQPNTALVEKLNRFIQAYPLFANLITKSQYQHQDINITSHSANRAANPSADDLLAMGFENIHRTFFRFQGIRPLLQDLLLINDLNLSLIRQRQDFLRYQFLLALYREQIAELLQYQLVTTTAMLLASLVFSMRAYARGFAQPRVIATSPLIPNSEPSVLPIPNRIYTNSNVLRPPFTVFQLSYMDQTVAALQAYQVSEDMIRQYWQQHPTDIDPQWGPWHKHTLLYFIGHPTNGSLPVNHRLSIPQALQEMTQLNSYQIQSLKLLYLKGLRGSHLRTWYDHNQSNHFTVSHMCALQDLVMICSLSVEDAMSRIYGLSGEDALHVMRQARSGQDPDDEFVYRFAC